MWIKTLRQKYSVIQYCNNSLHSIVSEEERNVTRQVIEFVDMEICADSKRHVHFSLTAIEQNRRQHRITYKRYTDFITL